MRAIGAKGLNSEASRAATGEILTIGVHESLDVIRGLVWGWHPTAQAVD